MPKSLPSLSGLRAPSKAEGTPENVERQVRYAFDLLSSSRLLRQALDKGDAKEAALFGYWVGRYYEALRVCGVEHNAVRGRTTLRGAVNAGKAKATPPHIEAVWRTRYEELRKEIPDISDLKAAEMIGNDTGGNVETIRYKIRTLWKKTSPFCPPKTEIP